MAKTIEKTYGLWRKITWPVEDKDLIIVEYKWDKYQIIELIKDLWQAINTVIWCSHCEILEVIEEKEIRVLNIIETWRKQIASS